MPEERKKIKQVVTGAKQRVSNKLEEIWWWFMIRGIMAVGLAIAALFWPQMTIGIMVNLLGVYLLLDGVIGAVGAVRSGGQRGFPVFAIASMAVGAILLFWTGLSIRVFLTLVGVWAVLQGTALYLSNRSTDSDAETRQLFGIAGAILAASGLILIVWPGSSVCVRISDSAGDGPEATCGAGRSFVRLYGSSRVGRGLFAGCGLDRTGPDVGTDDR